MSCGCRIRVMVSEEPLMYGIVAIVTVVGLVFVKLHTVCFIARLELDTS